MTATTSIEPCILDTWDQCARTDEVCARALGLLLLSDAQMAGRIGSLDDMATCLRGKLAEDSSRTGVQPATDSAPNQPAERLVWLLALAQILDKTGQAHEAEAFSSQAVQGIVASGLEDRQTATLLEHVDRLLRRPGQEEAASSLRRRVQTQVMMARNSSRERLQLRETAYEAFQDGEYAQAERIYRHLLARNFEPVGTACHLARVLLVTGRDSEAGNLLQTALERRTEDQPYTIVRLHYLRALVAALADQETAPHLAALETALEVPGARCSWLLAPVLDAVRPRLAPQTYAVFTRLAGKLNDQHE